MARIINIFESLHAINKEWLIERFDIQRVETDDTYFYIGYVYIKNMPYKLVIRESGSFGFDV